ncbi:uncharacterized protein CLUP02_08756 [Colletotrichum lupini]|uniref:Uncharacterized protein n=1 Tax=Colletotrichum lupini TaxID=145971 RepID=A0A9Q8STF7_9PEZI|nr:uncharacterized protein CLUP02_08756 [Colletotrichum lupini]UQC83262.1 hypothetical protein CLUP02_08756 [Colletotrichum lupini]
MRSDKTLRLFVKVHIVPNPLLKAALRDSSQAAVTGLCSRVPELEPLARATTPFNSICVQSLAARHHSSKKLQVCSSSGKRRVIVMDSDKPTALSQPGKSHTDGSDRVSALALDPELAIVSEIPPPQNSRVSLFDNRQGWYRKPTLNTKCYTRGLDSEEGIAIAKEADLESALCIVSRCLLTEFDTYAMPSMQMPSHSRAEILGPPIPGDTRARKYGCLTFPNDNDFHSRLQVFHATHVTACSPRYSVFESLNVFTYRVLTYLSLLAEEVSTTSIFNFLSTLNAFTVPRQLGNLINQPDTTERSMMGLGPSCACPEKEKKIRRRIVPDDHRPTVLWHHQFQLPPNQCDIMNTHSICLLFPDRHVAALHLKSLGNLDERVCHHPDVFSDYWQAVIATGRMYRADAEKYPSIPWNSSDGTMDYSRGPRCNIGILRAVKSSDVLVEVAISRFWVNLFFHREPHYNQGGKVLVALRSTKRQQGPARGYPGEFPRYDVMVLWYRPVVAVTVHDCLDRDHGGYCSSPTTAFVLHESMQVLQAKVFAVVPYYINGSSFYQRTVDRPVRSGASTVSISRSSMVFEQLRIEKVEP